MIDKGALREILIDNRKMVANMKVIRRDVALRDELRYVFVGVRRAGKSFLMFQRMQDLLAKGKSWNDMLYINFEDDRLYGFDVHDFDTRVKNARKSLEKGDKVKASIRFKGRQIAHPELAKDVLVRFEEALSEVAEVEIKPKLEGRSMFMQLTPKK
jgi:hypothetical protein